MYISEITITRPDEQRGALENEVYRVLGELSIDFARVDNDAVEAMEDCVAIEAVLGAQIRKSVLLCNRQKTVFYLLVMPADKPFVTKDFSERLSCPRVSFAPAEKMQEYLGLLPGSASIMGLLNDRSHAVQLVLDQEVMQSEWFGCNPGANTSHLRMRTVDLLEHFLPYTGHKPVVVEL